VCETVKNGSERGLISVSAASGRVDHHPTRETKSSFRLFWLKESLFIFEGAVGVLCS
jgi:hypothetical protein